MLVFTNNIILEIFNIEMEEDENYRILDYTTGSHYVVNGLEVEYLN